MTVAKAIAFRVGKQRYAQGEPWSGSDRGSRHSGFPYRCCRLWRPASVRPAFVRPPAWPRYQSAVTRLSLDVTGQENRELEHYAALSSNRYRLGA